MSFTRSSPGSLSEAKSSLYLRTKEKRQPIVALVDCNNFYASCERVFRPDLEGKPVVVLSNNDGCIIARSNESKALGLKMGDPYFKVEPFMRKAGVTVFSSNYALYGDMSQRVMATLQYFSPELEIYSIDEAFLNLSGVVSKNEAATNPVDYGRIMRATVKQWTGIPVSVGIAATKTLAKIANRYAKKQKKTGGVFHLRDLDCDAVLERTEVEDVWGIGPRYAFRLRKHGVTNARELRDRDERWIQKTMAMGIVGVRLVLELRGIPCLPLDLKPGPKKEIACTRSFGKAVTTLEELKEATASYTARAAQKLRSQNSMVKTLMVYVMTNPFKNEPQYYNSASVGFSPPTASTPEMINRALEAIEAIYRPGYRYKKTGVVLTELLPGTIYQPTFFDAANREQMHRLMHVVDHINARMGPGALQFGATGVIKRPWHMRRERCSNAFTTQWFGLAEVRGDGVKYLGDVMK
jgi:DNA polymerase V